MKGNQNMTVTQLKAVVRHHKLNKPHINMKMKKAQLIAGLKKEGHWDNTDKKKNTKLQSKGVLSIGGKPATKARVKTENKNMGKKLTGLQKTLSKPAPKKAPKKPKKAKLDKDQIDFLAGISGPDKPAPKKAPKKAKRKPPPKIEGIEWKMTEDRVDDTQNYWDWTAKGEDSIENPGETTTYVYSFDSLAKDGEYLDADKMRKGMVEDDEGNDYTIPEFKREYKKLQKQMNPPAPKPKKAPTAKKKRMKTYYVGYDMLDDDTYDLFARGLYKSESSYGHFSLFSIKSETEPVDPFWENAHYRSNKRFDYGDRQDFRNQ
tara:strand:- start:576 stop:1529 length:954 start_codon:yes stop_codon:yes gene_type:complete